MIEYKEIPVVKIPTVLRCYVHWPELQPVRNVCTSNLFWKIDKNGSKIQYEREFQWRAGPLRKLNWNLNIRRQFRKNMIIYSKDVDYFHKLIASKPISKELYWGINEFKKFCLSLRRLPAYPCNYVCFKDSWV